MSATSASVQNQNKLLPTLNNTFIFEFELKPNSLIVFNGSSYVLYYYFMNKNWTAIPPSIRIGITSNIHRVSNLDQIIFSRITMCFNVGSMKYMFGDARFIAFTK